MSKKNKNVTSKGGNSFLTIKSSEEANAESSSSASSVDSVSKSNSTKTKKVSSKSEEEKIEEFTENVTKILDKVEGLRILISGIFQKRFSDSVDKLKTMASKGKLKFLKPILPALILFQKINERWFKGEIIEDENEKEDNKPQEENKEPTKPVTFLELAEKNIIFTDNKKVPLYSLEMLKGKNGYVASESVIAPMVIENIVNAFIEVAPKAKAIPTPETGKYANIPMTEVMSNINEKDIMEFLEYVKNFPRGYVGKNYRITESFAGWAVSGTPDD